VNAKPANVLVTGAGSGIGRSIALALAATGISVGILDFSEKKARAVCGEINKTNGSAIPLTADVAEKGEVENALAEFLKNSKSLDAIINCAGVSSHQPFVDLAENEWDRILSVNLKGTFLCCQAAIRHMLPRRSGRLVNIASNYGLQGAIEMAHYAASKGGVIALTKSIALEYAPYGITANAVAPGPVDTPMAKRSPNQIQERGRQIPMGRIAVPGDIVGAALFFAVGDSNYITGQILHVNGGALMP